MATAEAERLAEVEPTLPPGYRWPVPLATLNWYRDPIGVMRRGRERFGDVFTLRIAYEGTWVFLADPEDVRAALTADPRRAHAGEANVVLGPVVGERSLLLLDEDAHLEQRKLLLPPFHGQRMHGYGELMEKAAQDEIERWPIGQTLESLPSMQTITLEVMLRAVFGLDSEDELAEASATLRRMLAWTVDPRFLLPALVLGPHRLPRLRPVRRLFEPTDRLLYRAIRRHRQLPDLEQRGDILSLLIQARHESGEPMSDAEIRDELVTLLIAGHETTATALAWTLERLVRHPAKMTRLREEVEAGEEAYLDAVLKESLRMRPPAALVLRRLTEPMEVGGRLMPAGVSLAPCIYLIHHREDIYPEPDSFRPERFLESPPGTYTWIPFGGGVRRCIGAAFAQFEMKAVLRALLEKVELRPEHGAGERVGRRAIVLIPKRGGRVTVQRAA